MIGVITDTIDDYLADANPNNFTKGTITPSEIMPKYKAAQDLWGRAKRSELIEEAFERAGTAKSGFENGLRDAFNRILRNKKQKRFFKPKELEAMKEVVQGVTGANVSKLIGRFGFSEGQASNMLMGSLGVAGGAAVGGPAGAVALPLIGQVSKTLAQKLTRNAAQGTDLIVRAGKSGPEVAKAYFKITKPADRTAQELTELLLRPDISLNGLKQAAKNMGPKNTQLVNDAVFLTNSIKAAQEQQ